MAGRIYKVDLRAVGKSGKPIFWVVEGDYESAREFTDVLRRGPMDVTCLRTRFSGSPRVFHIISREQAVLSIDAVVSIRPAENTYLEDGDAR